MWVRGLKLTVTEICIKRSIVAPYVGAWIETRKSGNEWKRSTVAPYVGAWIETMRVRLQKTLTEVAPYVGAWIET